MRPPSLPSSRCARNTLAQPASHSPFLLVPTRCRPALRPAKPYHHVRNIPRHAHPNVLRSTHLLKDGGASQLRTSLQCVTPTLRASSARSPSPASSASVASSSVPPPRAAAPASAAR